jgi:hypothetical protein
VDSSNGGLMFYDNTKYMNMNSHEVKSLLQLPNIDINIDDIEIMKSKPKMPIVAKRLKASRNTER